MLQKLREKFHLPAGYAPQARQIRRVAVLMAAVLLAAGALGVGYPLARRARHQQQVGQAASQALGQVAVAISHYSGAPLRELAENPRSGDLYYQDLAALLYKLRQAGGYENLSILAKKGGQFVYVVDAGYRANAREGVDYPAPGQAYPLSSTYKSGKSALEAVAAGRQAAAFGRDFLPMGDGQALPVYCPLTNSLDGALVAVLAADVPAGAVAFEQMGPVNTYLLGGLFLAGGILSAGAALLCSRYLRRQAAPPPAGQAPPASPAGAGRGLLPPRPAEGQEEPPAQG